MVMPRLSSYIKQVFPMFLRPGGGPVAPLKLEDEVTLDVI